MTSLSTGESYTYDANGNMITRVEGGLTYTQTFDAENRLISVVVSGQTTTFNPLGKRASQPAVSLPIACSPYRDLVGTYDLAFEITNAQSD